MAELKARIPRDEARATCYGFLRRRCRLAMFPLLAFELRGNGNVGRT